MPAKTVRSLNFILTSCCLLFPRASFAQLTLTGAAWFSSTPAGGITISQGYADGFSNTLGGDGWWDLWIALNPDASSPVNGPTDDQAPISLPMSAGHKYRYYFFSGTSGPCCTLPFSGLSLFFDGNGVNAGMSVFGPLGTSQFLADGTGVLSLAGNPVAGAGTTFYSASGVVAVLTEYNFNPSSTPPGNVCQPFMFAPDPSGEPDPYGSFTVQVWTAASLSLSQMSGPPGTPLTFAGNGFESGETIIIYGGEIAPAGILATAVADATGSFTVKAREPQHAVGPTDFFALGTRSQSLGAANLNVTPALAIRPLIAAPGGSIMVGVAGFGANENVGIYWDEPRQLLATVSTGSAGNASTTVTVPINAAAGRDALVGFGQVTKAVGLGEVRVQ